jgi:late competence protein required for DNA uptake (superfamily II DNA/RNA helicase)
MILTHKQQEIINEISKNEKIIQINAFAGTGKTTILYGLCR